MGQDPRQLRSEIAATRARLDDTIDAIEYKADVPARAKETVAGRVETVKESIVDAVDRSGEVAARIGIALGNAAHAVIAKAAHGDK
jgi:hypothetical protein